MMPKPDAFLERLKSLPDDELALALASDPELFKKAQKALTEAKRQELDAARLRAEAASREKSEVYDLKSWSRARTLVTSAYNESNSEELTLALAKTSINSSPDGQPSLLRIALDYLTEKQTVTFDWPSVLYAAGARPEYDEVESFFRLLKKRKDFYSLGTKSSDFLHEILNLPLAWGDFEKRLGKAELMQNNKGIINFLFDISPSFNVNYTAISDFPRAWDALANLACLGCCPLTADTAKHSGGHYLRWQSLARLLPKDEATSLSKVAAFATVIDLGWCDKGAAAITEHLNPPSGTPLLPPPSSGGLSPLLDVGSRAALSLLCLHVSSVAIFNMICDREELTGFPRFDALGRTRLYWVNERSRITGVDGAGTIDDWAQRCLASGDAPESVNAQNPLAKCQLASLRNIIASNIESRLLLDSTIPLSPQTAALPARPRKAL